MGWALTLGTGACAAGNVTLTRTTDSPGEAGRRVHVQSPPTSSSAAVAANDDHGTARRSCRPASRSPAKARRWARRLGRARTIDLRRSRRRLGRDRRDKPIAAPVHRLNELGLLGIIAERLTDEADRFGERRFADVRVLPRHVHQRLLRDDAAGAFDEMLEDGQRTGRQAHFFAIARQQPIRKIEAERTEVDDRSRPGMKDQRPRRIVLLHQVRLYRRRARRTAPVGARPESQKEVSARSSRSARHSWSPLLQPRSSEAAPRTIEAPPRSVALFDNAALTRGRP